MTPKVAPRLRIIQLPQPQNPPDVGAGPVPARTAIRRYVCAKKNAVAGVRAGTGPAPTLAECLFTEIMGTCGSCQFSQATAKQLIRGLAISTGLSSPAKRGNGVSQGASASGREGLPSRWEASPCRREASPWLWEASPEMSQAVGHFFCIYTSRLFRWGCVRKLHVFGI